MTASMPGKLLVFKERMMDEPSAATTAGESWWEMTTIVLLRVTRGKKKPCKRWRGDPRQRNDSGRRHLVPTRQWG